jgi:hypothetical protein
MRIGYSLRHIHVTRIVVMRIGYSLRHIHDPVLSSLKMKCVILFFSQWLMLLPPKYWTFLLNHPVQWNAFNWFRYSVEHCVGWRVVRSARMIPNYATLYRNLSSRNHPAWYTLNCCPRDLHKCPLFRPSFGPTTRLGLSYTERVCTFVPNLLYSLLKERK